MFHVKHFLIIKLKHVGKDIKVCYTKRCTWDKLSLRKETAWDVLLQLRTKKAA